MGVRHLDMAAWELLYGILRCSLPGWCCKVHTSRSCGGCRCVKRLGLRNPGRSSASAVLFWTSDGKAGRLCTSSRLFSYVGPKAKRYASGGEVSHLESWLPLRFVPRSSGQIAKAFAAGCARLQSWGVFKYLHKLRGVLGTAS